MTFALQLVFGVSMVALVTPASFVNNPQISSSFSKMLCGKQAIRKSSCKRYALILDWNDESQDSSSSIQWQDSEDSFIGDSDDQEYDIAARLTEDKNKKASFARMAVANSPLGHRLTLNDIEQVEIIDIDDHHLEMSAVVCEDEGCVTISVPVEFPKDCESAEDLECVLDNIFELDMQAQDTIRELELESARRKELTEEDIEEQNDLYSDAKVIFPAWWVPANSEPEMVEECDTLKKLLNNGMYQKESNALARRGLEFMDDGDILEVIQTAITAVGSSGLYLRSKAKKTNTILDEGTSIVDIPLSFGIVVDSASDLRGKVLETITNAMDGNH